MIVVDASAVVLALGFDNELGRRARAAMLDGALYAPAHLDLEVLSSLRRLLMRGRMHASRVQVAVDALAPALIRRVPHEPLIDRIWSLRENLTPYDAAYVALAEKLNSPLLTADVRLANATGPRCEFVVLEA